MTSPAQSLGSSVGRLTLARVFSNAELVDLYKISSTVSGVASTKLGTNTRPSYDSVLQHLSSRGLYSKDGTTSISSIFPRLQSEQIARTIDVLEGRLDKKYEYNINITFDKYPILNPIKLDGNSYSLIRQVFYNQLLEVPFIGYLIDLTFNDGEKIYISTLDKTITVRTGYYGEAEVTYDFNIDSISGSTITVPAITVGDYNALNSLSVLDTLALEVNNESTLYEITNIAVGSDDLRTGVLTLNSVVGLAADNTLINIRRYNANSNIIRLDGTRETQQVTIGDGTQGSGLSLSAKTQGLLEKIHTEKHINATIALDIVFVREGKILAGPVRAGLLKINGATHTVTPSSQANIVHLSTIKTWEDINQVKGIRTAAAYMESTFKKGFQYESQANSDAQTTSTTADGFFRNSRNANINKTFKED